MEKHSYTTTIPFDGNFDRIQYAGYAINVFIGNHPLHRVDSISVNDSISEDGTEIILDVEINYELKEY